MSRQNKVLELKKHVAAIHSTSSMTLVQRKIANGLLYNAYAELLDKDEHQISIKALCELIGYDSHDHKVIKKALVNLLSTVIEWNLVDGDLADKEGIWNASSIIADASIKGSICSYSYSKRMKELLYRPEMYGRLNMAVQAKFKSSYGLALYENCIRYQNIQCTPWFEFNKFRKLMGVETNKYLIFRDFKRRVLDKAIEEVNHYAHIHVKLELKKAQRQVVAVRFGISANTKSAESNIQKGIQQVLQLKYGLSEQQIINWLSIYPAEYILEKMDLIENTPSFKTGKINNLAKYLESALVNNFQKAMTSQQVVKMEKKQELSQKFEQESINKAKQDLMPKYQQYLNNKAITLFNDLPETVKSQIHSEFKCYLDKTVYLPLYEKSGLENPIVQDELSRFIKVNHTELLQDVASFDDFFENRIE